MERPQNEVCPKCDSGFEDKDLAVRCDGCANWHHMRCAPMTKAAFDAIGKNDNIHWFCSDCDHKIMSFISKVPKYSERREKESHNLSRTVEELSNLTKELKGLDVKKKLELFEGVTTCIGPKIQHLQDTVQKVDRAMSTVCNQNSWSKVVSGGIQTKSAIEKSPWNPEASIVITGITDFKETQNSSTIKTELSKQFKETKFKSVMKRANGNIIIETENKEIAKNMKDNWSEDLFGGSQCRLTKKRLNNSVILKDVPLPSGIERTGINESQLKEILLNKYPGSRVERFKRQDGTPMHLVKVTTETEEQSENLLQNGIVIGSLWVQAEKMKRSQPKIIQCYKCLRLGYISLQCKAVQKCSRCGLDGHSHKDCNPDSVIKCGNCGGNHVAVSHECEILKKKLKELEERQNHAE